jgi:cell division septation protein DedD
MFARALVILLVVLNLGVALWWASGAGGTGSSAEVPVPQGVARLQLASEAMPEPAPVVDQGEVAASGTAPQEAHETVCVSLGPFAADAADAARASLATLATRVRLRESASRARGWRVLMPALPDRATADAMAGRLRQAGFQDLLVMGEGPEANSIALGLFGSEDAARAHVTRLAAAGFEAGARAIGGEPQHWLDVALAPDATADAARRVARASRADAIDCGRLR